VNIIIDLTESGLEDVDWINLAHNAYQLWDVIEMVIKHPVT